MGNGSKAWWCALARGLTLLAAAAVCSCGDDGESPEETTGERCFQAGGIDANCLCDSTRPRGIRHCMQDLTWSECACGEPLPQPCVEGEQVQCPPCDGMARTTTCLRAGTFDCGQCDDRGGRGSGVVDAGD